MVHILEATLMPFTVSVLFDYTPQSSMKYSVRPFLPIDSLISIEIKNSLRIRLKTPVFIAPFRAHFPSWKIPGTEI